MQDLPSNEELQRSRLALAKILSGEVKLPDAEVFRAVAELPDALKRFAEAGETVFRLMEIIAKDNPKIAADLRERLPSLREIAKRMAPDDGMN